MLSASAAVTAAIIRFAIADQDGAPMPIRRTGPGPGIAGAAESPCGKTAREAGKRAELVPAFHPKLLRQLATQRGHEPKRGSANWIETPTTETPSRDARVTAPWKCSVGASPSSTGFGSFVPATPDDARLVGPNLRPTRRANFSFPPRNRHAQRSVRFARQL